MTWMRKKGWRRIFQYSSDATIFMEYDIIVLARKGTIDYNKIEKILLQNYKGKGEYIMTIIVVCRLP